MKSAPGKLARISGTLLDRLGTVKAGICTRNPARMGSGRLQFYFKDKHSRREKDVLGATVDIPGHARSNSRNCIHDLSYMQNPILGATPRSWKPKFQPKFAELFFLKIGVVPARPNLICALLTALSHPTSDWKSFAFLCAPLILPHFQDHVGISAFPFLAELRLFTGSNLCINRDRRSRNLDHLSPVWSKKQ